MQVKNIFYFCEIYVKSEYINSESWQGQKDEKKFIKNHVGFKNCVSDFIKDSNPMGNNLK